MPIHGYPGGVITANPVAPTSSVATGVWTTEQQLQAVSQGNWPGYEYPIANSLRFNSADSAYLNRTPASTSNRQIWTYSTWVKRSSVAASKVLLGAVGSSRVTYIWFNASNNLGIYSATASGGGDGGEYVSSAIYRDPSAWYHIVVAYDSTQATSTNRIKAYVNGIQITAWATATAPTLNHETQYNWTGAPMQLGAYNAGSFFDGYLTEVNFIDGQALTPSDFGLTNPQTGQWIPKKYTGTYGTNGFYLNFKDATSTTTLGYDYSGNANNWTTNNFSVTAGSGNDSLTDVPTPWIAYNTTGDVGGVVRGNYATLNPLYKGYGGYTATITPTNGNLDQLGTTTGNNCIATQALTGKTYFEMTVTASSGGSFFPGIINESGSTRYYDNSGTYYNGTSSSAYGASFTTNDIIGVAVDNDALSITFYKNGTSQGTKTSAFTSGTWFPFFYTSNTQAVTANFGQRPFAYTPPAGFRSLCTTNLPATAIGFGLTNQASKYMNVVTYTGTGSPLSVTGVGFKPDWVWAKKRSALDDHVTSDALRGVQKDLTPNSTAAEATNTNGLQSFDSDGFSIGSGSGAGVWGGNSGATYVAWCWKASNAAGVTNTAGSITSTVSANTTSGFSIATFTGIASAFTFGHGLGTSPAMVFVKYRNAVGSWLVYHQSLPATYALVLNTTAAQNTAGTYITAVSSTTVSIGTGLADAVNFVAYCFAAVPGYSSFSSYTGNGNADGPFVYLGFRPEFVMTKRTDGAGDNWTLHDAARSSYNVASENLRPNTSGAEGSYPMDFLSNGFKWRQGGGDGNESGASYIFAAFAESPFQFANAR